jgi:hypothetical protein
MSACLGAANDAESSGIPVTLCHRPRFTARGAVSRQWPGSSVEMWPEPCPTDLTSKEGS